MAMTQRVITTCDLHEEHPEGEAIETITFALSQHVKNEVLVKGSRKKARPG